jgi:predicted nuclease of predicted toxin-antitoxin system
VKFLVDAQLPQSLSEWLKDKSYDSIHTMELPAANATDDKTIREISSSQFRILITKDTDFENSYYLKYEPAQLILVSTGNISNAELMQLFANSLPHFEELLHGHAFLEMAKDKIIVRV